MKSLRMTDSDIKTLKSENIPGTCIACMIVAIGTILTFVFSIGDSPLDPRWLVTIAGVAVIAALAAYYAMNGQRLKDIRHGQKTVKTGIVAAKEREDSHEPGSGILYIPILGDLFPKLWGQKMRRQDVYYITVDNVRYKVPQEIFDGVGEGGRVEMYYTGLGSELIGFGLTDAKTL